MDEPRIEKAVREILEAIGEDPDRDGLQNTPARVAAMYTEVFSGLHADPDELHNLALDPARGDLVAEYSAKLEALISEEIGDDRDTWVLERPNLVGWPEWRGDAVA